MSKVATSSTYMSKKAKAAAAPVDGRHWTMQDCLWREESKGLVSNFSVDTTQVRVRRANKGTGEPLGTSHHYLIVAELRVEPNFGHYATDMLCSTALAEPDETDSPAKNADTSAKKEKKVKVKHKVKHKKSKMAIEIPSESEGDSGSDSDPSSEYVPSDSDDDDDDESNGDQPQQKQQQSQSQQTASVQPQVPLAEPALESYFCNIQGHKLKLGHKSSSWKKWSYDTLSSSVPSSAGPARIRLMEEYIAGLEVTLGLEPNQAVAAASTQSAASPEAAADTEMTGSVAQAIEEKKGEEKSVTKSVTGSSCQVMAYPCSEIICTETPRTPHHWDLSIQLQTRLPHTHVNKKYLLVFEQMSTKLDANNYTTMLRGERYDLGHLHEDSQLQELQILRQVLKRLNEEEVLAKEKAKAIAAASASKKNVVSWLNSMPENQVPNKGVKSKTTHDAFAGIDASDSKSSDEASPLKKRKKKTTTSSALTAEQEIEMRHEIANAARDYKWKKLLMLLEEHPQLVNSTRPGGKAGFTPLHQMAHGGAPAPFVAKAIQLGALRTVQTGKGVTALQIARKHGHTDLYALLQ